MPKTWQTDVARSTRPSVSPAAVAQLLEALRSPEPAGCMLRFINESVEVEYLSMVYYDTGQPRQIEGHSLDPERAGLTDACFSLYLAHFSWADPLPRQARQLRREGGESSPITAHVFGRHEIPDEGWRNAIFDTHQLAGRLSLLYTPAPGSAFALNLYRHHALGDFQTHEVERLLDIAPLLREVHHHALGTAQRLPRVDQRVAAAEHRLLHVCPGLTPRERQVCARISSGMTTDGIAADLGVAPSTIVTLRKRAYAKLGIADRLGLARLVY